MFMVSFLGHAPPVSLSAALKLALSTSVSSSDGFAKPIGRIRKHKCLILFKVMSMYNQRMACSNPFPVSKQNSAPTPSGHAAAARPRSERWAVKALRESSWMARKAGRAARAARASTSESLSWLLLEEISPGGMETLLMKTEWARLLCVARIQNRWWSPSE